MSTPVRESAGCVLGVTLGLAALAALVAGIVYFSAGEEDGGALLAEWFEIGELPFGLEVESAARIGGRTVVVLEDPEAPEEPPKEEVAEEETDDDGGKAQEFDWSAVPEGPPGTSPIEVLVVRFASRSADSELERLFGSDAGRGVSGEHWGEREAHQDLAEFGPEGGRAVMDRGRMPWREYSVLFVHERELEPGGTFVDTIRANLDLPERPFVVFARWPRGTPGSAERMKELLAAFGPRS